MYTSVHFIFARMHAASRECPQGFVRCDNGQCIHQEEFCDMSSSCIDGSLPDHSQLCRKYLQNISPRYLSNISVGVCSQAFLYRQTNTTTTTTAI